jgi:tight adherence protein B
VTRAVLIVAAAVAALALAAGADAGRIGLVEGGGAQFPFRSYVLTLPSARNLAQSQVHVTENGVAVHGLSVLSAQAATQRQFPVVLAIDASQSMAGRPIQSAMAAARAFAAHRSPGEQLAVLTFNNRVDVLQKLTTDQHAIDSALANTPTLRYGTHIYDALDQAATMLNKPNVQAASIVLLSDGTDVGSKAAPAEVLGQLAHQKVRVFTIGLASRSFDRAALQRIASTTGATYTEASRPASLVPIYDALGYQLSREYLLSYQSLAGPGQPIRVGVRIDGIPGAAAAGYVTPALHIAPAPAYHPSTFARILQSPITMVVIALLLAAAVGCGIAFLLRPRPRPLVERIGSFVSVRRASADAEEAQEARRRVDLLRGAEGALEHLRWWPRFKATLELADINASPTQIVLLTLLGTLIAGIILYELIGAFGVVLAFGVPFIARALIHAKLDRKRRAFAEQLPDNLEVLAAALRAGQSLVGALSAVVEISPEPANSEFRRALAEEQLGVPLEDALGAVVKRMDNNDLDQVALVARLQRETGSNAAEVIEQVVQNVRSRAELRRLVRTLTAQGRLSRWVLTAVPIVLVLFLPIVSPGYLNPLLHHLFGKVMLVFATLMVIAGSVVIGKIVNIKV